MSQQQRALYQDSMSQLWADLSTSERCRVVLQEEMAAHQRNINRLNTERVQKDATLQHLHTQVGVDEAQIATLTAQINAVSLERDLAVERFERGAVEATAHQQNIERLRCQQDAYQDTISQLHAKVESVTTQIEVLIYQLGLEREEVCALRRMMDERYERVEQYASRISGLLAQIDAQNHIIQAQRNEIDEKDAEMAELKRLLQEARGIAVEGVEYCHEFGLDPFAIEVCPALLSDIEKVVLLHLSPTLTSITHQMAGNVVWVLATWQPPADPSNDNDAHAPTPITLRIELDPILYSHALFAPKFKITRCDADGNEEEFPVGHRIVHIMKEYMGRCWRRGFNPPVMSTVSTPSSSPSNDFVFDTDPRCVVPYDADEGGLIAHLIRYAMLRMETYADFCVVCDRPIQDAGSVICRRVQCDHSFNELGVGYASVGLEKTQSTAPLLARPIHKSTITYTSCEELTVLLLSQTLWYLPTSDHHAWVCSAGSKGYCALKEMLQNGKPGNTLLIESDDLKEALCDDSDTMSLPPTSTLQQGAADLLSEQTLRVPEPLKRSLFTPNLVETAFVTIDSHPSITTLCDFLGFLTDFDSGNAPERSAHYTIYTNRNFLPSYLLRKCDTAHTIDLSPLGHVTTLGIAFLGGCRGLKMLDLSPLIQVTEVRSRFLVGCESLTTLDVRALSNLKIISSDFMRGCCGLQSLDLRPLSRVTCIHKDFLYGCSALTSLHLPSSPSLTTIHGCFLNNCSSLTTLDVSPLSNITEISSLALFRCTGLVSLDLSPMVKLRKIEHQTMRFLQLCPQIETVVAPPNCPPPRGWTTSSAPGQWKRSLLAKCVMM